MESAVKEEEKSDENLLTRAVVTGDRRSVFSRFGDRPSYSLRERLIRYTLRFLAYLTMGVTVAILIVLLIDAVKFLSFPDGSLKQYHIFGEGGESYDFLTLLQRTWMLTKIIFTNVFIFLTGTRWEPFGHPKHFGMLPLLSGTLKIAIGSALVALPLGFGTAIFLTQYASRRFRAIVGPMVEILGGIPTVVYGYFAITAVTPFLKWVFGTENVGTFNALSASIVVGVGIMPMVSSLSSEALRAVPFSIKQAAYSLGMRKFHVVTKVIIPASASGVVASFMLAIARAIGETMAVTLAAGATPNLNFSYMEAIQTMTAFIVQMSLGDTPAGSIEYYTIYAIGLTLFVLTFTFNFAAARFVRKFREVYQ